MLLPELPEQFDEVQRAVLAQFRLDVLGTHGLPHWRRVWRNGLKIAEHDPKVDIDVLALFAMLHDSQRVDEWEDPMHGVRGGRFATDLFERGIIRLDGVRFHILKAAITDHANGFVLMPGRLDDDARTIQACWDADRLDLPRVGVMPDLSRLGTAYALRDGVPEAHWEEAWNTSYPNAMIEV